MLNCMCVDKNKKMLIILTFQNQFFYILSIFFRQKSELNIDMIKKRKIDGEVIVSLYEIKKLNTIFSERIGEELGEILEESEIKLLFDLSDIKFIDSAGFSMLRSIDKKASDNSSQFILCNISPEVQELLNLLDLQDYFTQCKRGMKTEEIIFEVE